MIIIRNGYNAHYNNNNNNARARAAGVRARGGPQLLRYIDLNVKMYMI